MKDNVRQLNCARGTCLSNFFQARDETVGQFVCRLRQGAASCDFAEFEDGPFRDQLIDKCYSSHLRRKFNLEQEGTVTLHCLLINTDK